MGLRVVDADRRETHRWRLFPLWIPHLLLGVPMALELLPPLTGLVWLAPGVVELHQRLQGFSQADLAGRRNLRLAPFHPLVAGSQERLGVGVLPLVQQRGAEQGLGAKRRP